MAAEPSILAPPATSRHACLDFTVDTRLEPPAAGMTERADGNSGVYTVFVNLNMRRDEAWSLAMAARSSVGMESILNHNPLVESVLKNNFDDGSGVGHINARCKVGEVERGHDIIFEQESSGPVMAAGVPWCQVRDDKPREARKSRAGWLGMRFDATLGFPGEGSTTTRAYCAREVRKLTHHSAERAFVWSVEGQAWEVIAA